MDAETAKRECRAWLDQWQEHLERLRRLLDNSDALAPDSLRVSFGETMPGMRRAAKAAIVWFEIIVQIRAGDMRCGESGDQR